MTDLTPITPASSIEQIAANKGVLQAMKARIKELERLHDEQMLEYIDANGPIEIGDVRYYVGVEKKTKCLDKHATTDAILRKTGGDIGELTSCMAAQPFKHGSCRSVLGDDYDKYFITEEKPVLKDGVPTKRVLSVPTNLIAQRSAS